MAERLLSARQLEVLELLAKGLVNREIAGVLGVAPATVKRHVAMLIEALGVKNRTEAATVLLKRGAARLVASPEHTVPGFGERPAIAVLPFDNPADDPDQQYFVDGLVEDLTTRLASWRWFPVVARNSAFATRDRDLDAAALSRELGAAYLIEGSVRRDEGRVQIDLRLVEGTRGEIVLHETFGGSLGDVFALQDEAVERIVAALYPALFHVEGLRAGRRRPHDLNAWECLQRGVHVGWGRTREALAEARSLFQRAHELDPGFAQPLTCLAGAHIAELTMGFSAAPQESLDQALACAKRALELDDCDAAAHFALSGALFLKGRVADAEAAAWRTLELDPSFARAYWGLSLTRRTPDQADEAVALLEKAIRLSPQDPMLPEFHTYLASAHFAAGRDQQARAEAEQALRLHPETPFAQGLVAAAEAHLGHREEAAAALEALLALDPNHQPDPLRLLHPAPLVDRYVHGLRMAGFVPDRRDAQRST